MIEKTISTKRIYDGKILNLRVDEVLLPNNKTSQREIIEHNGAVAMVAVNDDNELLLVKQYRKAVEEVIIEIPAGKLELNEDPDECAIRELIEETGFKPNKITRMFDLSTSPGFCTEIIHIYLAEDLEESFLECDDDEFIEVVKMNIDEAVNMISTGEITDSKTIAGLLYYKINHAHLTFQS
jgi:ADP-ribose pyrophosphatase